MERSERAAFKVHLSLVNTQISSSLTNVMVQGVSLNNPAAAACATLNPQLRGDNKRRESQRSSSLMFCSIFQHLQHNRQKNNKATRSWGLSEPHSTFPPSSSQGRWRNMLEKKNSGWRPKLPNYSLKKIINHSLKSPNISHNSVFH